VLAIQDPPAALEVARHITDPWYRCQALANAAEHIGERKLALRVLQEALDAADEQRAPNRIVTVASWPLRVLVALGEEGRVRSHLERLMQRIAGEPHPIRRMDGQMALLAAVKGCGPEVSSPIFEALLETLRHAHGWRRDNMLGELAGILLQRGESERGWALVDECELPREARKVRKMLETRFGL
jgi:hypothetical protein